jgi:hypothetical protein
MRLWHYRIGPNRFERGQTAQQTQSRRGWNQWSWLVFGGELIFSGSGLAVDHVIGQGWQGAGHGSIKENNI